MIANYYGNVTHIDGAIGGILKTLEELGLADDTIVVHTADHGEMLGAHAMGQKEAMYEEAMKVPWLMRVPSLGRKQKVVEGRFSHIDLVPTLLELMDKPIPERLQGKSLVPVMKGDSASRSGVRRVDARVSRVARRLRCPASPRRRSARRSRPAGAP